MINLQEHARLLDSDSITGRIIVDMHSCVSKCKAGKYIAIGCYSFVSRCDLGNYITIASRCSIGAFNHPVDWLSVCEFQYRDTSYMFDGETLDSEFRYKAPRIEDRTCIGSDVWIGDNAVVLQGVTVGDGAIIGAGSVVTKNVENFSIVVGNPARHIRYRFDSEIRTALSNLKWWQLDLCDLKGVRFSDINLALEDLRTIINN